ncbi:nucleoside triphosphate pyrophosphohydrolase [Vibrio sp. 10N.286.49.B3]|uniref:nucleoside triphosphate pyrophosphohydrolase n=1 Tax=Vibrio sp. 10N.286.49.B3 TaxID=1880855 RepID=UPI000C84445C|nr:nucleoside triphosphate pyrophosphohydrolase [Vibrio sp. 10N.286.49.B3]PMH43838.1 nucleoside triphosphate pyrophosphohydrolase [Vibrio sp. 10N.286.49.B3]
MSKSIESLLGIMEKLRDPEQGCPWDKQQTFSSIVPYTIEETYEVVDAIHQQDWPNLKEELGDLLYQVIFYSQLAKEQSLFDFDQVVEGINEKLIRRHPYVFSMIKFENEEQVAENWEATKAQEKAQQGTVDHSILDSVPNALPALSRAMKIQKKCSQYGFDWDTLAPVADKVLEEVDEVLEEAVQASPDKEKVEEELGDLLFATVNFARHLGHNPEVALAKANLKFERRFRGIENIVAKQGKTLGDFTLNELDALWEQVKLSEKK